jgi:hypothetical protein
MEEQLIKIISVDKEHIRESAVIKGGWIIPFKLSAKPNESWERHFYEVHRKSVNPKKKDVKLIEGYVEVQFSEGDNQQQALDMLNEDVTNTNTIYRDVYLKKIQIQDDMKAQQLKQQGVLQKLKNDSEGLKF